MKQGMALERAERHRGRTAENGAYEERRTKEKPPTTGRLGEGRGERGAVSQGTPRTATQTPNAVRGSAIARRARQTIAPMFGRNGARGGS